MVITKEIIRRYLLWKQLLLPPQSLSGYKGIAEVFNSIRSIQFDPQNPCGTNVDLVLQARVKDYHPLDYYAWLYRQRKGIECFDKELCVVLLEDLSFCRKAIDNFSRQNRLKNFAIENTEQLNQLLAKINTSGEICSTQINDNRKVESFWGNPKWGKAVLDVLWKTGKLVISKRLNGRKYFDLPQKLYGTKYQWTNDNKLEPEHIIRRIKKVGILPKNGTEQGWLGIGKGQQILPIVDQLVREGILTELQIEHIKKKYVMVSSDIKQLKTAKSIKVNSNTVFLAPLDNLLWDRDMIRDVFDFEYKWEVYTPKNKRKYEHYTLPILYGDKFIGRIEPKQIGKTLEIRGLWLEPNFQWNESVNKSFYSYMETFKDYLRARTVKWLCDFPKNEHKKITLITAFRRVKT